MASSVIKPISIILSLPLKKHVRIKNEECHVILDYSDLCQKFKWNVDTTTEMNMIHG